MRRVSIQALLGPAFVLYLIADAASAQGALDAAGWVVGGLAFGLSLLRLWAAREHEGSGGSRVGWLSLSMGFALVHEAVPGALSLTGDLTHVAALCLASTLLIDLSLCVPDRVTGSARLRRLRGLMYTTATCVALVGAAAHAPPLSAAGRTLLVPAMWAWAPWLLWLLALLVALGLRVFRRRLGSDPEALAGNAWGLMGLVPTLAVALGVLSGLLAGLELTDPALRLALAFGALCIAASHIKLVDPKERLRVGRTARDGIAAATTLACIGAAVWLLGPAWLPRAPLPLSVSAIATLLLSLSLYQAFRSLAQRVFAPFGGRLLSALETTHEQLAGAITLEDVAGVVLRACRAASGDASAEPRLYITSPELTLDIDLAGQPRCRRGGLKGPLAERLAAEPGELVLRAPLEAQNVRMPAWRPLIEQLRALDALCAVPLIDSAELEGVLIVPRGLRRSTLSLEELDALQRFARYVTGFVAVLSSQERSTRRTAEALADLSQARDEIAQLQGEVDALQAQVLALRTGGAQERLGDPLLAYSAAMRRLLDKSGRFDRHEALLLIAEGGTPLHPLAQHIHAQARPADAPFVIADAASLSTERNTPALFDLHDEQSLWRLARGGSLLLLDLPSLSPDAQWALRERLAEQRPGPDCVRVLASSRVALETLRERGGVMAPLLDCFAQALVVPPLRERPEDLPSAILLAIDRACRQLGRPTVGIEADARAHLSAHNWPGNLAELASVVERAARRCSGPRITLADLPPLAGKGEAPGAKHVLDGTLDSLERKVLQHAMERARGNKSQAARLLGLPRTTLVDKLRRHGLDAAPGSSSRSAN